MGSSAPRSDGHARLVAVSENTSLAKIGTGCGVSKQAVHRWIHGGKTPPDEARRKLEEHFGIPLDSWNFEAGREPRQASKQASSRPSALAVPTVQPPADGADADPDAPGTALEGLRAHVLQCISRRKRAEADGASSYAIKDFVACELRALAAWGRATGEMSPGDESRLTTSGRFLRYQNAIVQALLPFPEAIAAVVRALAEIEPEAARAVAEMQQA